MLTWYKNIIKSRLYYIIFEEYLSTRKKYCAFYKTWMFNIFEPLSIIMFNYHLINGLSMDMMYFYYWTAFNANAGVYYIIWVNKNKKNKTRRLVYKRIFFFLRQKYENVFFFPTKIHRICIIYIYNIEKLKTFSKVSSFFVSFNLIFKEYYFL